MTDALIAVLDQIDLLRNLPGEVLGLLAERATTEEYAAGDVLFDTGAQDDTLYIVQQGAIDVRRTAEGARLATLGAGQSFGELAAFDAQPRSAAAVARTDAVLVAVTREHLMEVFEAAPQALLLTVSNLARSLTAAKEEITLMNLSLEDRIRERTAEVRQAELDVIRRLCTAAECRDDVTGAHIFRMSRYCAVLARAVGMEEERAEQLLIAAPMHDVGKIAVPDDILNAPGRLSAEQFDTMRRHTTWGAEILAGSDSTWIQLAEQIAIEHHEHWNGSGYPNQLAGEEISLEARICSIADVFDALTSVRPYKEAWEFDRAWQLIVDEAGTQFDPDLVELFVAEEEEILRLHDASREGGLGPRDWKQIDKQALFGMEDSETGADPRR